MRNGLKEAKAAKRPVFVENKTYDHLSDEDIVKRIVAGKPEDFSALYDRYCEPVFHKCISFVKDHDTAKDLSHDVFIKTFLNLSKFSFQSKFSTWLYSITYNYCVDHVKMAKKTRTETEEDIPDIAEEQDHRNEEELLKLEATRLIQTLDSLHPDDKALLLMKYQDDMSIRDIQMVLSLNESAVKMRIKRARAKAMDTYQKLYGDER
jgi:RNA polymerase sigma factor (sigma-70 family)